MRDRSRWTWRHCHADLNLWAIRWSRRDALSARDVAALRRARGVWSEPTTVVRGRQGDAPALDQRGRPSLRATHESSRVDATDRQLKKPWHSLDRAVDSTGARRDVMVSAPRDAAAAAAQVCRQGRDAAHTTLPRGRTGDQNAASPPAFEALQPASTRPATCLLRPWQDVKQVLEQEQRFVKRRVTPG
jgi:transposase, IS6 family